MNVIEQLRKHYRTAGSAPFSVKELLAFHGRKWLKDADQMVAFEQEF